MPWLMLLETAPGIKIGEQQAAPPRTQKRRGEGRGSGLSNVPEKQKGGGRSVPWGAVGGRDAGASWKVGNSVGPAQVHGESLANNSSRLGLPGGREKKRFLKSRPSLSPSKPDQQEDIFKKSNK